MYCYVFFTARVIAVLGPDLLDYQGRRLPPSLIYLFLQCYLRKCDFFNVQCEDKQINK